MADEYLRIRILDALQACIAEISPAGGYTFDLTPTYVENGETRFKHVVWGHMMFGEESALPLVSILEVPIPLDQAVLPPDSPYSSGTWELLIQGFVENDPYKPTRPAHRLMGDVKKRLAIEKRKNKDFAVLDMGLHITDMRIGAGVVRPPDEVSEKAYFWLNLSLDVVEDLTNPHED